jgi:hypothetical protein
MASTTTSEQRRIEPAIMASEIERLPDLEGFLKFASIPDWMRVALSPMSYPTVRRARRTETMASTLRPAAVSPAAASSDPGVPPATPSSAVESRAATRKGVRKPAADATAIDSPRDAAGIREDNNYADVKQTESVSEGTAARKAITPPRQFEQVEPATHPYGPD